MASESRLVWIIFAVLVALIVVPLGLWQLGESRRPVLEEVRIVTAAADDPVFRTGIRRTASQDGLLIAAALRFSKAGGPSRWLAPVEELEIDGELVEHLNESRWPESDRVLRVFWFTIEASYLGGDLTADTAAKLLSQRSFLAPEMGRGLLARAVPEQHNDDQINLGDEIVPIDGGTIRLYARVEIAEKADVIAAEQTAASAGADAALSGGVTEIRIAEAFPEPVSPVAGELFRLPGFEPQPVDGEDRNGITAGELGATFTELVERRFAVSSQTFAAVALTGGPVLARETLTELGQIELGDGSPARDGRTLRWGADVLPGDLLEDRGQFIVLLADDGDSVLGLADRVMSCWRRPASMTTLEQSIRDDAAVAELLRHE